MTKGSVRRQKRTRVWICTPAYNYEGWSGWPSWSQAMAEYRRIWGKMEADIMKRLTWNQAEVRAVLCTDGMIVKGDKDFRPGDPIMGPDNRVHTVERVLSKENPPVSETCEQGVLPL